MAREYWWALITLVIAVILAIVLMLVARENSGQGQEQLYQGVPLDAHLIELDKKALEASYHDHLKLLFGVWLKDDPTVVHRINTGLKRARQAYAEAAAKIQEREKALGK